MPPTCHTLLNGMQSAQILHREADRVLSDPTLLKQSRPLQKTDATRSRPAFFRGPRAHSVRQHLLVKAESAATNIALSDKPCTARYPGRPTGGTPHTSAPNDGHTSLQPSHGAPAIVRYARTVSQRERTAPGAEESADLCKAEPDTLQRQRARLAPAGPSARAAARRGRRRR